MKKVAIVNIGIQLGTYYVQHEIDIEEFEKVTGEKYENCNPKTLKKYCAKNIDQQDVQQHFNDDCSVGLVGVDTEEDCITEIEHDYYDEIKEKEIA